MARRQKDWAARAREKLMAELGGRCVECGSRRRLEFDCVTPMGGAHHKYDPSWRMSFYRQQHKENNLQILCKPCNGLKSDRVPF